MTSALKATLYRDRRRLALVTLLAFLAGALFYWPSPVYLGHFHISLLTGTVYAIVVFVAALIVCTALPRMRFMVEAVAVSRLLLSCVALTMPELGKLVLSNPFIMAVVVVAGGACISRMLHGQIQRHATTTFPFGPGTRHSVVASGTPRQQRFVAWVEGTTPLRATA